MGKISNTAEHLLDCLGDLSNHLSNASYEDKSYFDKPLQIINQALGFHVGVLYKIANVIENDLILEVMSVCSPYHDRQDLREGMKICLDINNPPPKFVNEVLAFKHHDVSAINVPGVGSDIAGSVYLPESQGFGYLLAGDFLGDESDTQEHEVRVCEVMCNMLSAMLMKTQFEKLASYDGLTGLLNSRAIREALEGSFQRQKRKRNTAGAVVLTDIDFFKKINDQHGHIQGDSVLQEVGGILDAALRKYIDATGRYGGEEFLLICEDAETEQVVKLVERLRQTIENHKFIKIGHDGNVVDGEWLQVTMSFGIAPFGERLTSSKELLAAADAALYQSKIGGRNRVTLSAG